MYQLIHLENMTHKESPWISTRSGLRDNDTCNKTIEKNLIGEYFGEIKEKYNMRQHLISSSFCSITSYVFSLVIVKLEFI